MVYCWKCSDANPDHYRFCGQCGSPAQRPEGAGDVANASTTTASVLESVKALLGSPASSRIIEIKSASSGSYGVHVLRGKSDETRHFVVEENGERKEYASLEEMPEDLRKRLESAMVLTDEKLWRPGDHPMESLIRRFRRPYPFDGIGEHFSKTPDWALPPTSTTALARRPAPAPEAKPKKSAVKWLFWLLALYGLYKLLT